MNKPRTKTVIRIFMFILLFMCAIPIVVASSTDSSYGDTNDVDMYGDVINDNSAINEDIVEEEKEPKEVVLYTYETIFNYKTITLYQINESAYEYKPFAIQDAVHQIAENARALGLSEDNPIIVECKRIWQEQQDQYEQDRDIMATTIYNEAWGGCSQRHRELVGAVVYNRYRSQYWPNTIYDVVAAPHQYNPSYCNPNSYHGRLARSNADNWKVCQDIATKVLKGEIECDYNVVFQANFKQGTGIYETHYTSYSTTYFCYGKA